MGRGSTALVTGAAGALGGAVVERFHALGWRTALIGSEDGAALAERFPAAIVGGADLTDEASARRAVLAAEAAADGLDAVINVVGGYARTSAADVTLEALRTQLDLNLVTAVTATTAALPGMLRRGGGTVVGIAAGQAVDGGAGVAPYAASKAALVAYLRSLDHELAPRGVRTVVVYPMGTLDTQANRSAMPDADPERWIATETLAEAIALAVTLGPRGRLRELRVFPDAQRQVRS